MSGGTSPVNGGFEAGGGAEPAVSLRLTVRKDLFPEVRLPKLAPDDHDAFEHLDDAISCVKLETDFEQSIDDIANQKLQVANGLLPSPKKPRHRKHKQRSRRDSERSAINGVLRLEKRRKKSLRSSRHRTPPPNNMLKVKGGKNLNLVSSSECQESDEEEEVEEEASESSEDEVLYRSVKLPIVVQRPSGKPYSHELSQLSTKKKKSKGSSKEQRTHAVIPCSGKPRSMMGICSSRSKKKSKKSDSGPTYQSQILDTTTNLKIKIKRTSAPDNIIPIPVPVPIPIIPTSIADLGQRKSKKKRAASPVASESSGEEYDPSRGDVAAISVAAPKTRTVRPRAPKAPKAGKSNFTKSKDKSEKTEKSRVSAADSKNLGPQSPWADRMPEEILEKIFDLVVATQGTLPTAIRLGRVCKLWHSVSCRPQLWKNVDLAQYTSEKCKTDYKLVWLLENRLSKCQSLNIAQWKVCNVSWVLACVADYCPGLVELSVAGWSRITPEQLFELLQGLPALQRLDLSLTSETGGSSTCLSAASMARLAESFGSRLTHLTLANNKFTALPQILSSVAAHCENLEVLDISGAQATSHPAAVPLEALQKGCPKMRVFRAANSQLVLATATTSQQMESCGWTQLEELSIAGEAAAERVAVGEYRLGDEALARLVRGATRLRLLDLRGLHRLTDSGLVRVPAWDLQHLFLGGCNVTRQSNACLELICEKWSHSLIELDLSWASAERVLDAAVCALAESTNSKLKVLNLCGSSVSLEPIKKLLMKCHCVESLNLSSCRALPRGMKRLFTGKELQDLKDSFDPNKPKAKDEDDKPKKKGVKKKEADSKSEEAAKESLKDDESDTSATRADNSQDQSSSSVFQEPKSIPESETSLPDKTPTENRIKSPPGSAASKSADTMTPPPDGRRSARDVTPKLLSPLPQSRPDSSSTPRSDPGKTDLGSPHFSPLPKPDSQVHNSPDIQTESVKSNSSWNLGQFKTTPTHKSEASPLNRLESQSKVKHGKMIEQCSPTTSLENKQSPETIGVKQDIKNPNNYYGNYSPMPRQDTPFSSQRSPYSAQPSPAQPSPYSTQPSPYSTQPSPYSSQPSPYSAQPSPDTSQIVKPDLQKSGAWNPGSFSPMPKHPQFSPHPSTHTSPDPGISSKGDLKSGSNKAAGQYSPMSRQDRIHQSPYSPRPSVEAAPYSNKKSPANVGKYSPMMRPDCHLPSPDAGHASRPLAGGRACDPYQRQMSKVPDVMQSVPLPETSALWGMDRFGQLSSAAVASLESLVWSAAQSFEAEQAAAAAAAGGGAGAGGAQWGALPPFESSVRRRDDLANPWTLPGDYHVNRSQPAPDAFVEQNVSYNTLSGHVTHQALQNFLDDSFSESSRVD